MSKPLPLNLAAEIRSHRRLTAWRSARARARQQAARVRELAAENARLHEQAEAARVRLWLIEQALAPIDIRQDPTGIVPTVGPYLDGPIHPTWITAYHAAQEA